MTLYEQLDGNGLIAFSDAAGAKAGLSLAKILSRIAPSSKVTIVSNKFYPFFANWKLNVEVVKVLPTTLPVDIKWVFTGTSHPESSDRFELAFLKLANEKNLPSFSFIEYWTWMALRFDDGLGKSILPSKILVVDEFCKKLAIAEGLPSERLEICKNPYLDYIENFWRSKLTNSEFRKLLKS